MKQTEVKRAFMARIQWHLDNISRVENGGTVLPDTPENRNGLIEREFSQIDELYAMAGKLGIKFARRVIKPKGANHVGLQGA